MTGRQEKQLIARGYLKDVEPKDISWFWKPFIAFGKVTLIQGDTRELAAMDDWSSREIINRCASMAKEAVSLWPLPDKYNQESESDAFFNMDEETESLLDTLRGMLTGFDPSITEVINKQYINYKRVRKNLMSLLPRQNGLNVYLAAKKENLYPNDALEDVSFKGHLGNGDTLMRISSEDDIWQLLEYIEQIDQDSGTAEDIMSVIVKRVSEHFAIDLKRITKKAYKSSDSRIGFVFSISKSYGQGNRKKFWYAYRKELVTKISGCQEQYVVFGCGTENVLVVPVNKIELILALLA